MSPTAVAEPAAHRALDEAYQHIPIEQLVESRLNPRKTFNAPKLEELAHSVREKGIVEPIVVRQVDAGSHKPMRFEIIAGARRYRASKLAGLTHLPAVIRLYTDAQAVEIMTIENSQRDDVPPLEEAAGYQQLLGLDTGYSAAMIAEKIGRTEKFVWDRLRLLQLVPEAQELLTLNVIGVEHAEVIAKLKPAEQKRVIARQNGGLLEHQGGLKFDDRPGTTAYSQLKPVSVRELKEWIARNIRFDVTHAAQAAPLDFGPAAARVEQAMAEPGRGKKVVSITYSHVCPDGAKDGDERTYGSTAWKKAENDAGEATCDQAVLGVVVAGEQYGQTLHVCIAREKCQLHWKKEIAEREKNQKLRESGKAKQADRQESKSRQAEQQRWKQDREKAEAARKAWKVALPGVLEVLLVRLKAAKTPALTAFLENEGDFGDLKRARSLLKSVKSAEDVLRLLALGILLTEAEFYSAYESFPKVAKQFGVDVAAILKKDQPAKKRKTAAA